MKKELEQKNKILTIFLIMIITVPLLLFLNSTFSGSAIFGKAIIPISFVKEDAILFYEVKTAGIKDITINFLEPVKDILISIEEIDEVDCNLNNNVYKMFEVYTKDVDKIDQFRFSLKVKKEDLIRAGVNPKDLILYQNCLPLDTFFSHTKGKYLYFTATSGGIGKFIIGN